MCFNSHLGSEDKFVRCPWELLSKVVDDFESQYDSKILVGFEIEFVLLGENSNLAKPMDLLAGYSTTAGMRAENLEMLEEIVAALKISGSEVYHFHVENADRLELAL